MLQVIARKLAWLKTAMLMEVLLCASFEMRMTSMRMMQLIEKGTGTMFELAAVSEETRVELSVVLFIGSVQIPETGTMLGGHCFKQYC